ATEHRQRVVDWAKGEIASWDAPEASGLGEAGRGREAGPLEMARLDRSWAPAAGSEPAGEYPSNGPAGPPLESGVVAEGPVKAMQVHDRYLVTESEEGVMVIDQHALHERILYEQLKSRVLSGAIESQGLLVPEPVDLSPAEAAAALEHRELLARLGMKIEPFGGDTVLVASYPAMLANMNPVEVLEGLVEQLLSAGKLPDRRDLLDELLHGIACKAAVKAGDRLAPEEITALLEGRHLIAEAHHCPHGRPTAVVFSREELDKQFKRI
ncbi:MAG: DNA mismatch repair protein MutL, partial [Planctomycetes bacterium]|nr:DNA mismatch repair protein MutL [Planctomycetota bacterium]